MDTAKQSTAAAGGGGKVGRLFLKLLEVRDLSPKYCIVACEFAVRQTRETSSKQVKHDKTSLFGDEFTFNVDREQAVLSIEAYKKSLIGGEKLSGEFSIAVNDIPRVPEESKWFNLVKPVTKKGMLTTTQVVTAHYNKDDNLDADDETPPDDGGGGGGGVSSRPVVGQIRVEMHFELSEEEVEPLQGTVVEGEWTEATSGGNLLGNPGWVKNPQFLLSVSKRLEVTITLRQPLRCEERVSFYIVEYDDDFYKGRRMCVLNVHDDVIRIDREFMCPVFAPEVKTKIRLNEGCYCIIPCSPENPLNSPDFLPHLGKFWLAASCSQQDKILLEKLPTSEDRTWTTFVERGEWTSKNSGGGAIQELQWTKNPQYRLSMEENQDVCVVLSQPSKEHSIGFYLIKPEDYKHKAKVFSEVFGSSGKFQVSSFVGTLFSQITGDYVIIPCVYESGKVGAFELSVFCSGKGSSLVPITREWKHKRIQKGKWVDDLAGGGPQNDTFIHNSQFLVSFTPNSQEILDFLVILVQQDSESDPEMAEIGFIVFEAPPDKSQPSPATSLCKDSTIGQVEGWCARRAVYCNVSLMPGVDSFVVVPSTFAPNILRSFRLIVYGDARDITIESLGGL